MDYEDNDYQTQTFQLAVEESVKFSPGSHSYSLPKFDLDDSLQVHLRFDSLVESEVLLGIRSHEENHWIEDFSRENSAIEFSSGAAESCSILRCNNVWSEATSSESVDLLLKSVGQDEMVMEEPIIEESYNCDDLDSSMNQMQSNLNQDSLSPPKSENDTCVTLSPPKPENATCAGSVATLDGQSDKDVVDQLPQIDSTSPNGVSEGFIDGTSGVLNSVKDENCKGSLFGEENYNITGVREAVSLVENTGGIKVVTDSGTPDCTEVNPSTAPAQNFIDAVVDQLPEIDSTSANSVSEGFIDGSTGVLSSIEDENCKGFIVGEENYNLSRVGEEVSLVENTGRINSVSDPGTTECTQVSPSPTCVQKFIDAVVDQLPHIDSTSPAGASEGFIDGSSGLMNSIENDDCKVCASVEENYHSTRVSDNVSLVENTGGIPECKFNASTACVQNIIDTGVLNDDTQKADALDEGKVEEVGVFSGMLSCQTRNDHLVDADGSYAGKESSLVQDDAVVAQPSAQISECEHGYTSKLVHKVDSISQITEFSSDAMATQYTVQISDKDVVDEPSQIDSASPTGICERSIDGRSGVLSGDAIDTQQGAQLSQYEHCYSSKDVDMVDLTRENSQEASFIKVEGKSTGEVHPANINAGSTELPSMHILNASDQTTEGCNNVESVAMLEDLSRTVAHLVDDGISSSNTDEPTVEEKMISGVQGNENSDDHGDHFSRLAMETCSSADIMNESRMCEDMKDECHGRETQNGISSSNTDEQTVEEKMISGVQGNENSDDHGDHSSRLAMETCSSADIMNESRMCEDMKDEYHCRETQNAEASCSSLLVDSQQRCSQSSIETNSSAGHLCRPDASELEKETAKFSCNSLLVEKLPESATVSPDAANKSSDIGDGDHHLQSHNVKDKAMVGTVDSDTPSYGDGLPTHAIEAGSSCLSINEPNCGSPTIISCTEASRNEKGHRERIMEPLDHIDSDNLEQDCDKVKHASVDNKENDASEGDKSFTFNISSIEDSSQKTSVSGWKPFPGLQPHDTPQDVACCGTPQSGFHITDSKIADHGVSGESKTSATPACNFESGKMPVALKSTERKEAAEGENSQDDNFLHGVEECQNGVSRLDPIIAVSGTIDQTKNVDSSFVLDPKEKIAAEVDRKVAVEVNLVDLSGKETCYKWKPVHNVQTYALPQPTGVTSPATSFIRQIDAKTLQEISRESSPRTSGAKTARRNYKSSSDRKKTSPGKVSEEENDKEGKLLGETISLKHTKSGGSNPLSTLLASPIPAIQVVKAGEKQAVGSTEGNSMLSSVTTIQTSNLPDLNSSSSSYTSCQQPFTDLQQVQLRAQIFVYGSIIQGTAPDEACMLAAFGESGMTDGGRNSWETVWRVAVERLHNQKSPLSSTKTPVHSHAGARATEATRQTVYRSEGVCTPSGTDSSKLSPVVFNPNMTFSSPVWAVSTACREGSLSTSTPKGSLLDSSKTSLPLPPFQSPPVRQYVGNISPWLPQAPSPGNWVLTQTAAANASVHPTLPTSETVRVTSIRESSASHRSGKQHTPVSPYLPTSGHADNTLMMDAKRTTVSPAMHASTETKSRKRGRTLAFEQPSQISSFGQHWNDPLSVTAQLPSTAVTKNSTSGMDVVFSSFIPESSVLSSSFESGQISFPVQHPRHPVSGTTQSPTFVATATSTSSMNIGSGIIITETAPTSIIHEQSLGGGKTEVTVASHEELCGKIEQAKRQAEDAAVLAATAVGHCQSIWSQIAFKKKSGIILDIASELESSAVAIAAAASVAKAAAAVTKVASEAAVQAKLMYDEAVLTSKYGNPIRETSVHDDVKSLGMVNPSSILKGRDQPSNADSVFAAVREAARKRVEAASASAKRAENLDAVLKAAEMTAEAVSQAGTIIAMGEPLPFTMTQLVDAGPDGYWRAQQKSSEQLVKSNNNLTEQTIIDGCETSPGSTVVGIKDQLLNKKETYQILDSSKGSAVNRHFLVDGLQLGSSSTSGKGLEAQNGCKEYGLSKTIGVIPESEAVSGSAITAIRDESDGPQAARNSNGNKFEEGSLVEVRSDEEGLRMVWFSAKVLNLNDGKAFVSYAEHARREGSSLPTEWVPLDDGVNAPRIRIPHPMNMLKNEGTKKRSREARGDYTWSVGDKVDAWIRNGWWEGIITEKGKEDETNLTVRFPGQQETSVVRAWNLRPSLIWEDGRWVEWRRLRESSCLSHGGDTPQGKPQKKSRIESEGDTAVDAKGNTKVAKPPCVMETGKSETLKPLSKLPSIMEVGKPEASKQLMLSAKEKVFNTGKNITKVNIGVPKPGRKRKYMDVKQCVSDRSNNVSKPTMLKPAKSQSSANISTRDVAQEPLLSKKKSSADVAINVRSKANLAPSGEKSIKTNEKSASVDHLGKLTPNAMEPRRSNRRIQPTSRLLEGLQSSLTVSKIPFASHDKGTKSQQSSSRGRSHG